MRLGIFGATIVASGIVLLSAAAFADPPPPVEAFGSLPTAELARISPDGRYLGVVEPVNGNEQAVFIDLTKPNSQPFVVGMQGANAGNILWKSNDRAIVVLHSVLKAKGSTHLAEWSRAVVAQMSDRSSLLLMWNAPMYKENPDQGRIDDMAVNDPLHVYMSEFDRFDTELTLDLYRVDLGTGGATMVKHGSDTTNSFITDGYGNVVGEIDQDSDLVNHVMIGANEAFHYSVKGGTRISVDGFTAPPDSALAVEGFSDHDTWGLYEVTKSGAKSTLFENPSYDMDSALFDPRTQRVIGAVYYDDTAHFKYFDPSLQRIEDALSKAFAGQSVEILSRDDAGTSYVIKTEGPRNPAVISLFTTTNHQVNIIQETYPNLKPSDLGEVKPYPYKARDGLDIHAYLTLPPGRAAHNLPTVIFPHGGPEARDSMTFDWWAQFMASRGYAVLQPNFRGSSGYGGHFIRAGDGEWAGKVQTDVQDGVKKLIADGIADPKRICIVGASYGGYMALAGATFSPDLYACAISYAGISDLRRMVYTGTTFESEGSSVWKRRIGADVDDKKLDTDSPANFADRVKAPVLLIHSDRDVTVPIEQSQIEERALKNDGKQVEFVTLQGDDHYLEFADTRIQLLKEVEKFLAAHIGDSASKPSP